MLKIWLLRKTKRVFEIYFGDNLVIRNSEHTTRIFNGSPASRDLRTNMSPWAVMRPGLENADYQQKQNGADRFELMT